MWFRVAGRKGLCTLSKVKQNVEFCGISKNDGRSAKMHFSVAGAIQETCSSEMLGDQGADFSLEGFAFC